jgi:thioredoxin-dependent peroxiredoxin
VANVTFKGTPVRLAGELPAVGAKAPDFTLYDAKLAESTLATYAGKTKILTINPSVDTSVCATTTRKFNEKAAALPGTVVLAISADLPFALRRFCAAEGIENVVALSTYRDPGFGARWGVRMEDGALASLLARAVIVIDGSNVVKHVELVPEIASEPDYDRALAAAR